MIHVLIWALATVDAGLVGFRDAAGRNASIAKGGLYRRGVMRGIVLGQVMIILAGTVILVAHLVSPSAAQVWAAHDRAALNMASIYLPYALVVIAALGIYAVSNPDISSLATVLVLGPFTAVRPLVIAAGGILAVARDGLGPATPSVMAACLVMLALHRLMAARWRSYDPVDGDLP